ncbi:Thiol-disulfide isomerase or thioredoxin [Pseudomonas sp. NFACC02]|uniref:TlpA disulfide reductase family protein n=1 Tax=Pseudomonas sp. NFACC02 TaxID=1566250 RepID=UPI0008C889C5|nr:TlpA disulfide reductase family protein [Pseudomonas sp. NFACC02]SEQ92209.1 Thiol-disulfide isomerase or thioredoxin [Pseudomonas sp. NFACC02]
MLSLSLGPFALAMNHLVLLGALALATGVGWISGRGQRVNPERTLFGLFVLGLLVARLAFVIAYWPQYRNSPLSILDIRDGGFSVWPGVIATLIGAVLRGWKQPALRQSMGFGAASGLLFWWLATLGLSAQRETTPLPDLTLRNAAGEPVQLSHYRGKPLVVNLWATWCPPCRREMPVLQAAQQANPEVVFLFVNQAESPRDVATFFASQGLHLDNVLFDGNGELAQQAGSAALPTTLFYRPDGRLLSSHLGELSNASLQHSLDSLSETATPDALPRSPL